MVVAVLAAALPGAPPAGAATASAVACSAEALITAIEDANGAGEPVELRLPGEGCTYTLTQPYAEGATPTPNGLPVITGALTIVGNGATIQRDPALDDNDPTRRFRLIGISAGASVTLSGLNLVGGHTTDGTKGLDRYGGNGDGGGDGGDGGAIHNAGTLTLVTSTLRSNTTGKGGRGGFGSSGGQGGQGGAGGAIHNSGTLTLSTSTLHSNTTGRGGDGGGGFRGAGAGGAGGPGGHGAAIHNTGTLSVSASTLHGNSTGSGGDGGTGEHGESSMDAHGGDGGDGGSGGALRSSGNLTLANVTVHGNTTGAGGNAHRGDGDGGRGGAGGDGGDGGGISADAASFGVLTHVTVGGGTTGTGAPGALGAGGQGPDGEAGQGAAVHVRRASESGSILAVSGATGRFPDSAAGTGIHIRSSILAAAPDAAPCSGPLTDGGFNVVHGPALDGCGFGSSGTVKADPRLGALADNGGPTPTTALRPGSPARDAIPSGETGCEGASADQRGRSRPDADGGRCDIGAFEHQPGEVGCEAAALIAALEAANVSEGADEIHLLSGCTYTLTQPYAEGRTPTANGLPVITGALTVVGHGATIQRDPTLDDNDPARRFRILEIDPGADVHLADLTLTGGHTPDGVNGSQGLHGSGGNGGDGGAGEGGGAILNHGTLAITQAILHTNATGRGGRGGPAGNGGTSGRDGGNGGSGGDGGEGGAILNRGTLEIALSAFRANTTGQGGTGGAGGSGGQDEAGVPGFGGPGGPGGHGGRGGAIANHATLTLGSSTLSDHRTGAGGDGGVGGSPAPGSGQGGAGGRAGNGGPGGAVSNHSSLGVAHTTFRANSTGPGGEGGDGRPGGYGGAGGAGGGGGAISNHGPLDITHTILDANTTGDGRTGGTSYDKGGAGGTGGAGGAIDNHAALSLSHATVHANATGSGGTGAAGWEGGNGGGGGAGGALANHGVVAITHTILDANATGEGGTGGDRTGAGGSGGGGGRGGAIANGGVLTIENTTLHANATGPGGTGGSGTRGYAGQAGADGGAGGAGGAGGGLAATADSRSEIRSATVVHGSLGTGGEGGPGGSGIPDGLRGADGPAGAGSAVWRDRPPSQSSQPDGAGGPLAAGSEKLTAGDALLSISRTVISSLSSEGLCAGGAVTDDGFNLVHGPDDDGCGFADPVTGDPRLGPLEDNGGPTRTMALQEDSPAIDAVPLGEGRCGREGETDQRGVARPLRALPNGHGGCDIGAYEAPATTRDPGPGNGGPDGTVQQPNPSPSPSPSPGGVTVHRWTGQDPIDAAIGWSRHADDAGQPTALRAGSATAGTARSGKAHPQAAGRTVLLGRADDFADSLASAGLQAALGARLLLTWTDRLDQRTAGELDRISAGHVIVLGGPAAISDAVLTQLRDRGHTAERLHGPTREHTAIAIAGRAATDATTAVLVRAYPNPDDRGATSGWADSLAAGALAAQSGQPVLLTTSTALAPATRDWLAASRVRSISVVGGAAAVSDQVLSDLRNLGISPARVSGPERAATATAVNRARGLPDARRAPGGAVLVDATHPHAWADGFASAHHLASTRTGLVLAYDEALPEPTRTWLRGGPALVCPAFTPTRACHAAQEAMQAR